MEQFMEHSDQSTEFNASPINVISSSSPSASSSSPLFNIPGHPGVIFDPYNNPVEWSSMVPGLIYRVPISHLSFNADVDSRPQSENYASKRGAIPDLVAAIKAAGRIYQPCLIHPPTGPTLLINEGRRRLKAAMVIADEHGISHDEYRIPVMIGLPNNANEYDQHLAALICNTGRANLTIAARAMAYTDMCKLHVKVHGELPSTATACGWLHCDPGTLNKIKLVAQLDTATLTKMQRQEFTENASLEIVKVFTKHGASAASRVVNRVAKQVEEQQVEEEKQSQSAQNNASVDNAGTGEKKKRGRPASNVPKVAKAKSNAVNKNAVEAAMAAEGIGKSQSSAPKDSALKTLQGNLLMVAQVCSDAVVASVLGKVVWLIDNPEADLGDWLTQTSEAVQQALNTQQG